MQSVLPEPDLIFWTGDNLPHVPDSMYTTDDVIDQMQVCPSKQKYVCTSRFDEFQNLTDLIKATFPDVPVYPVLGNHDYWEASQFVGSAMGVLIILNSIHLFSATHNID